MPEKYEPKALEILQSYLDDFDQPVRISDGYDFVQPDMVARIELYRASQFASGPMDSQGNKKYFFNILNAQVGNATKNIDLDTKDILIRSEDGADRMKAMLARELLMKWMADHKFGVLLNKLSEYLPAYGSFVVKKTPEGINYVPLKRLRFDPAIEDLQKSPYIIEELYFQPYELEKMKDKGWSSECIDEIIDAARKAKEPQICVYEVHAEFPNEILGRGKNGYSRAVCYISTVGDVRKLDSQNPTPTEVLYSKVEEEYPYKKLNYINIDGRALGLGIYEMNLDAQERWNEIQNQKSSSMKISSKKLFWTADEMVESNVLTDLLNGDVIKSKNGLNPVATEERNLAAYNQEQSIIMDSVRSNSNAFEVLTGEGLPSGTPYRLGALMSQNAGKLFEFIRENIGLFIQEIVEDWILPDFKKEIVKEQIFEIFDADLIDELMTSDINRRLNEALKKFVMIHGTYPSQDEVELLRGKMKDMTRESEFVKVIDGFLNFDFGIKVVVTDENYNVNARVETTSNMIQLLAQNPQIMQDPQLKKLVLSMAEDTGLSPRLLSGTGAPVAQAPALNQIGGMNASGMLSGSSPLAKA